MAVLLKDAIKPNLIQTLEGQPCLMHCGPFANIAHGNNSLVADQVGMKIADYVVTESGFGSDMGMEKFFDIVCRFGGLTPSAVVLVTTVRAIKHHGGVEDDPRVDRSQALRAIETGMANVRRHLGIIAEFGMPAVVAVNRRPGDTNEEVELVKRLALEAGAFGAEANEGFTKGGAGAADLASAVVDACEQPNDVPPLYADDEPIQDKIEAVAKRVYGAADVYFYPEAEKKLDAVHGRRARPLPGLHGQDAPVAVVRPDAAERAGALHAAGARHPRLHRRRLARAAVRRHHADAGPRQVAGRAQRRHRRRGADRRACSSAMGSWRAWSGPQRSSLVDDTELALRAWLATGAHRPGDRLPPELELAGDARRLARDAAHRARPARGGGRDHPPPGHRAPTSASAVRPTAFHEGLEVLRPYSELAERRGVALTVRDLEVADAPARRRGGRGVRARPPRRRRWTITRTILADGEPVAVMRDVVRPGRRAAAGEAAAARDRGGRDGARRAARARRAGRVRRHARAAAAGQRPRARRAARSACRAPTAVLELEEIMHLASGEAVQHSSDTFAPGGIDLQVRRNLEVAAPAPLVRAVGRG